MTPYIGKQDVDRLFMDIANNVGRAGRCARRQVGAVIVDTTNRIIAVGYAEAPERTPHCPTTERAGHPDCMDAGHCVRTVHAEVNAIINCARLAVSPVGCRMYVTTMPCPACVGVLINAGIYLVIYESEYKDPTHLVDKSARSLTLADEAQVVMRRIETSVR